jgi:hypothetical protein
MRHFGAASDVPPKFVSPSDPAAQWTGTMRGPVASWTSRRRAPSAKPEVSAASTMIKRTEQRFDFKPKRLAGDKAYGFSARPSPFCSTLARALIAAYWRPQQ